MPLTDHTSPTLYCPSDIHKTADAFQDSTKVYWSEPEADDDRDGKIRWGVCVCLCVRLVPTCVRACVHACVRACVRALCVSVKAMSCLSYLN